MHSIGYKATILFTKCSDYTILRLYILSKAGLFHLFQQLHFKFVDITYSYFHPIGS